MTETIDWTAPIELDNGVPLKIIQVGHVDDYMYRLAPEKDGEFFAKRNSTRLFIQGGFWYSKLSGTFVGGTKKDYFYVRNAAPGPDPTEGFFT